MIKGKDLVDIYKTSHSEVPPSPVKHKLMFRKKALTIHLVKRDTSHSEVEH